ncbi:cardiolipin synthase [Sphingomonas sp.]|uniref:cardiolipin synthase n=1 Tax=Sphingomonas sp. TaxID=28214 RepID=UPI0025E72B8A|nr:cardiolipin synthase [Sphingomonas sp.]
MSAELAIGFAVLAVHAAVILRAMLVEDREPMARTAWLLLLVALPVLGVILYLLFGEPWISTGFRDRSRAAYEALLPMAPAGISETKLAEPVVNAFRTCTAVSRWPASGGNSGRVAAGADDAIDMIVADIDAAERTVHLSIYIWLTDRNGGRVAEAICRAARRGVTCRVVADAIGSRAMIRSPLWRGMRDAGARMCPSLKAPLGLGFLAGHRVDLRNHRKIVVVDGRIAYCGSENCADAAFRIKPKFAPWVDIMIRYEGPVVRQTELIFASAWTTETGEDLTSDIVAEPVPSASDGFPAIAVGNGPLSPRGSMTEMFVAVLAAARDRVTITTPYFAPDPPLIGAIVAAGRRGVKVTIVFPRRCDSRILGAIARAYYPILARADVHIFEFNGGLLHAKTLVVDDRLALVGSSNMDRRSLDLNFENNVLFETAELAGQVIDHQRRWLADATEIDRAVVAARPMPRRLADNVLTMVAAVF